MPKAVIDTVLDRILDQQETVARAVADMAATKAGMKRVMRLALRKGMSREQFESLFAAAVLAHFAGDFPAILESSRANLRAQVAAINAAGRKKVNSIPALRKPDMMRRAAERAGATDGETTGTGTTQPAKS